MKKVFLKLCLISLPLSTMTSCKSDAQKAKEIYENKSWSNQEKIDRLYGLYTKTYVGYGDYNKAAADKAWTQIAGGDYQGAYVTTQTYKNDSYCYECIYYTELLQKAMPKPQNVSVTITGSEYSRYFSISFVNENLPTNCPIDGLDVPYYKGRVKQYDGESILLNSSFDTGRNDKPYANIKSNDHGIRLVLCLTPFSGWRFSYYNDKGHYLYSCDIGTAKSGTFTMQYDGTNDSEVFF